MFFLFFFLIFASIAKAAAVIPNGGKTSFAKGSSNIDQVMMSVYIFLQ